MEITEFKYGDEFIEFAFKEDLMINATEMAKIYNKKVYGFTRLESFKEVVAALEKTNIRTKRSADSTPRSSGNLSIEGEIKHRSADLVPLMIVQKGGEEGGVTWLHRYLAIDFAMWLDVKFKIWILGKIDEMLLSYTSERRNIAIRKKINKEQIDSLIATSKTPEMEKMAELLKEKDKIKGDELNLNKTFNKGLFN